MPATDRHAAPIQPGPDSDATFPARIIVWRRVDEGEGHSLARLERRAEGWVADAAEILLGRDPLACHFRVELDSGWRTRLVRVESIWMGGINVLELRADEQRVWWKDGRPAPELDGCTDVDVAATPLTNTFPIRRLAHLPVGATTTLPVAWVDVPWLGVQRVDQTYQHLGPVAHDAQAVAAWTYSDPIHGSFRLTVDRDGLVVDYEGFATRVR